jgi:hypothetical protein
MRFTVHKVELCEPHAWAVLHCSCDLADPADPLLKRVSTAVRNAYGEAKIIAIAEQINADPSVQLRFNLDAVTKAIRKGLPDPSKEANKPAQLTNFRSEAAEMVAKCALQDAFGIDFPVSPQEGKTNANQPILGFDCWGMLFHGLACSVVLVQINGTEDEKAPPLLGYLRSTLARYELSYR